MKVAGEKQDAGDNEEDMYLISDILLERPFPMYSMFLHLDKDPYYFKEAFQRLNS